MINMHEYIESKENNLTELNDCDFKNAIDALIEDENEAITGYDRVIQLFENAKIGNKEEIIKKLNDIKKDEYDHIEILKTISYYQSKCISTLIKQGFINEKDLK